MAIHPKGLMAVEHYLVVRNLMYRSVYNHRLNVVCNWLLEKLILTARQLGPDQVWADEVMATWLWQPDQIRLEDFLANDDQRTGYHLQRWQAEAPAALAELSGRFLDRRLLKATAVEHLSPADQLQLLATARRLADRHGQTLNSAADCVINSCAGTTPIEAACASGTGNNSKPWRKPLPWSQVWRPRRQPPG